jgi:alpha-tubulin suppressor-like RCC1 family protein
LVLVMIDAGGTHTCALTEIGEAYCWGSNADGQLGDGSGSPQSETPVPVLGGHTFQWVSAGLHHTCGVTTAGETWCWGFNGDGQLGDGSTNASDAPVKVSSAEVFVAVSAGAWHSCAVTDTGQGYCWGYGANGQLGNGTGLYNATNTTPLLVSGGNTWRSLSAGWYHTCAVTTGDVAHCWGSGFDGQLGDGTETGRDTPAAVSGALAFASVSAGAQYACGRTTAGEIHCWGRNLHGQLGDGTPLTHTPQALGLSFSWVTGGNNFSCALDASDDAYCWGSGVYGRLGHGTEDSKTTPNAVSGGHQFQSLRAGYQHACGVVTNGDAYCWGNNGHGQLGLGHWNQSHAPALVQGGHTWQSVSTGHGHTCGIEDVTGDAYCWGGNGNGEIGDNSTTNRNVPTAVATSLTFVMISAGMQHSCALAGSGDIHCWGQNSSGQLGDGTTTSSLVPVQVSAGGLTFQSVTAGDLHSCGVATDGTPYCWGDGGIGALGDGTGADSPTPVPVALGVPFQSLNANGQSQLNCGVATTGDAFCWGRNRDGGRGNGHYREGNDPSLVSGSLSWAWVDPGNMHACGVTTTGSAYCWGANDEGQLGLGSIAVRLEPWLVVGGITFQ